MDTYTYYGTSGDDVYQGTQTVLAYGYGGNDAFFCGSGDDTLYGGAGDDFLDGTLGNDFMRGGVGADTFSVGVTFNAIFPPDDPSDVDISSVDTIAYFSRSQGDKIFVYGSLNDYSLDQTQNIAGIAVLDTAIYYQNNLIGIVQDTTQVSLLEDFIFAQRGTNGDDVLIGEAGADSFYGMGGNDTIYGGAGNDFIDAGDFFNNGFSGDDVLYGEDGNDRLLGGSGNDTLIGDLGADTFDFRYRYDFSVDTITDFSHDQGDQIVVPGSLSNYSLDQTQNVYGGSALDTAIYYTNPATALTSLLAIVQDTTQVSLSSDFIFV